MCSQPGLTSLLLIPLLFGLPGSPLTVRAEGLEVELAVEMDMDTTKQLQTKPEAVAISKSLSILKSDTINDNTFHRSQSKRAATLAKLQPLISATTQITKPNDERTTTTTTGAATMHINDSMLNAVAAPLANYSSINNISNNGEKRQWTTVSTMVPSMPRVTAALQANLIMSNRNVEEQKLDEHEYKITQNNNALFALSSNIYSNSNSHSNSHSSSSSISNSNSNNSTAISFGLAETSEAPSIEAIGETTPTTTTTITVTATAAATTTTTTRRPAPRTTLKPPPTIDDYQTIISQAGTHAYLPCNVKQLVKKPISWLRMRDGHILTVDQTTFIADQRFQSVFSPNPERWSLQIKYVQVKDEGTYECQVSTEPKASAIVHLRIVEPKTELIGESTRHVKAGSQVKLRCIISQALEPPLFINWFYNQKQIYLHNRRGWRTEIERIDLPAEVPATSTAATTTTATATSATSTSASTSASVSSPKATVTSAETLNDIAAITRSYILDAIAVGDGTSMAGYGYVLPTTATPMHTTATMSTLTAAGGVVSAAATAVAADTPGILTLPATAAATAAATSEAASTTTTTAAATTMTTTTPEPSTTTTTILPSSSFIKQITTASLIIPAVVKLDSGNYTCSPSNSAPRTIVLHVLNGEYSASAIKSASVSWNTLIGYPGNLRWPNVSTILTLLWIIKFVLARYVTICCSRGRDKVNNRPTLQDPVTQTTITKATSRITARKTASESVSRRLSTQTKSHGPSQSQSQNQNQATTRRQRRFGLDCGCGCCCGGDCGHVSSSISGTKVAEDKT